MKHVTDSRATAGELRLRCGFRGLRLEAGVGVYDSELGRFQPLEIDLDLEYQEAAAAAVMASGDFADAVDYARAADIVRGRVSQEHHGLLERLAALLLKDLRAAFPSCRALGLEIRKPEAVPGSAGSFCRLDWRL